MGLIHCSEMIEGENTTIIYGAVYRRVFLVWVSMYKDNPSFIRP
jgi:hypothetical protein